MNQQIDEIYTMLKNKYGISKVEIERITDSQFKVLENNIKTRGNKVVNLIYLGKFKPSKYFLDNYEVLSKKYITLKEREDSRKNIRDNYRMVKSNSKQESEIISGEIKDM